MSGGPPESDPLTVSPPSFDPADAERIAEREFDKPGAATELGGERDQNFRIDAEDGQSFVLKISSAADDAGALELQLEGIRHTRSVDPDLPVMEPVSTTDGSPWTAVDGPDGDRHFVRLFTHVPGRRASSDELDREALYAYGAVVARLGKALRGFFHPDAEYDILWDVQHTPRLRSMLDSVTDEERRTAAAAILDRFDERVDPVFETLRAQVIHNDLTLDNVLFDDDDRVSGIVDFGDLTHTALVCDLAVALASVMLRRDDPFAAARAVIKGYASVTPLEEKEARLLGDLLAGRVAALAVIVAWQVPRYPDNADYVGRVQDETWDLLTTLVETGLDVVGRRLQTAALEGDVPYTRTGTSELLPRRRDVLGASPLTYDEPIHMVAGEGAWLFDANGERYLDAYNNVPVVGHGHPAVARAIASQARTLATNTRYLHESVVELGERLKATLPADLDTVVLVNSGSEAIDIAYRLSTAYTGRDGAIVSENAYHGITAAATALSPETWPDGHRPAHVETVPPPSGSVDHGVSPPEATAAMTDAVAALEEEGPGTAAFVFDSLFASDGILPPDEAGLGRMTDIVRDADGLIVADEVQAGFGRTGSDLWGFQAAGVEPDVVAMGKPMGNGHPVAAVATRSEIAEAVWNRTGLFSTFGGNPVSSVAALAVLDVIEEEELLSHTVAVGEYLGKGLTAMADEHDIVGDVRRRGLIVGMDIVREGEPGRPAPDAAAAVVNGLRQRRVLIGYTGPNSNVLKIRPPLVFDREQADQFASALDAVLSSVDAESR